MRGVDKLLQAELERCKKELEISSEIINSLKRENKDIKKELINSLKREQQLLNNKRVNPINNKEIMNKDIKSRHKALVELLNSK